jgi:hypothetical protein
MAGELPRQFAVYPPRRTMRVADTAKQVVCGQVSELTPLIHLEVRSPDATTTRSHGNCRIRNGLCMIRAFARGLNI